MHYSEIERDPQRFINIDYYVFVLTICRSHINGSKVVHIMDYSQLMRYVDIQWNLTILATSALFAPLIDRLKIPLDEYPRCYIE